MFEKDRSLTRPNLHQIIHVVNNKKVQQKEPTQNMSLCFIWLIFVGSSSLQSLTTSSLNTEQNLRSPSALLRHQIKCKMSESLWKRVSRLGTHVLVPGLKMSCHVYSAPVKRQCDISHEKKKEKGKHSKGIDRGSVDVLLSIHTQWVY